MPRKAILRFATVAAAAGALWVGRTLWAGQRLPVAAPMVVNTAYDEQADTLEWGETLSDLLARHNIVGQELYRVLAAANAIDPRRVKAGQVFQFRYVLHEPAPHRITVRLGNAELLRLERDSTIGWRAESETIGWAVERQIVEGTVRSSLYETVDELIPSAVLPAQERARLIWDLADGVFGWVIDFTRDNYEGDAFQIVFERLTSDLGDVRFGRILAVKLETRGTENAAYAMTDDAGRNVYYDAEGHSLRRAFKLYPAEFRRISSGFSRSRFHPILRRNRAHLGIDYSAGAGTPIMATGDGTVVRAGRWGSYGIVVAIRHPKGIETRYAHMSKIERGIRAGVRIRQGQRIGYVGMTGLATAPHLHYEFIKNGRHVDPRSAVRFGEGDPVAKARRAEFDSLKTHYDHLFDPPAVAPSPIVAGMD
jgi:murein DD-endopeptidase MepM/ murein hydrolase activator NlpD